MATDIAFSLGVLSLLGARVPFSAKVFLLALAIADDIGAVVVIALFYTASINFVSLAVSLALLALVVVMNRVGVRSIGVYLAAGVAIWLATFDSGVHATLAGVALGLLTPALLQVDQNEGEEVVSAHVRGSDSAISPLDRLERAIHPWVSYAIVPIFALANAGVVVDGDIIGQALESNVALGVALGLLVGKPLGIFGFTWLAVRMRLCELPLGCNWGHILGVGMLAGIGFTVSLLIAGLAFREPILADEAKLGVLVSSVIAAVTGFVFLRLVEDKRGIS